MEFDIRSDTQVRQLERGSRFGSVCPPHSDSRFKIQDSAFLPPAFNSRFKIQDSRVSVKEQNLPPAFNSRFKIQDSRFSVKEQNLPPAFRGRIQDSRFKIQPPAPRETTKTTTALIEDETFWTFLKIPKF